ncbi:hypothetical protein B0J17DRAFT_641165 [Rhizoctonia solani]|nr:hypothetical protein B0J17DRAFT_641165 [Rhizoctonia solani]
MYPLNMTWATLPPEIIIRFLDFTNLATVKSCRQVCRQLCELIDANIYLQFRLLLDDMGYQPPINPREDLSLAQMMQALRENRDGWQLLTDLELRTPLFIKIEPENMLYYSFVDGLFAHTLGVPKPDEGFDATIHFHQLASINKGTEYRHWHHPVDCNISYIAIQPELDLLVLLSYQGNHSAPDSLSYQIHLRTISTNDPHPLAVFPIINLDITRASQYRLGFQDNINIVQTHGRMVGIRFCGTHHPERTPLIMVWDWVDGIEVAHLELQPAGKIYSMTFISEEYFVIPEFPELLEGTQCDYDHLGHLNVYRTLLENGVPQRGYHVASFALPTSFEKQNSVYLEVSGSPLPAPVTYRIQPKVYERTPGDHQIRIYIHTSIYAKDLSGRPNGIGKTYFDGLLYVSTRVLLESLDRFCHPLSTTGPCLIPWTQWGCYARWVSSATSNHKNGFAWGHRHAFKQYTRSRTHHDHTTRRREFCILEVSRKAELAAQGMGGILEACQPSRQIRSLSVQDRVVPMAREGAEQITFHEALCSGIKFTKTMIQLEEISETLKLNRFMEGPNNTGSSTNLGNNSLSEVNEFIMIDDEHIIILVLADRILKLPFGLFVYNIGHHSTDTSVIRS